MALWLFKEEPDHYSFDDLGRDGRAVWDGVTNALALQNLRKVRPGDRVLYYHTGKVKAVVGEMRVAAGEADLANWELVRLPRLSVMPVTEAQWRCVEALSEQGEREA